MESVECGVFRSEADELLKKKNINDLEAKLFAHAFDCEVCEKWLEKRLDGILLIPEGQQLLPSLMLMMKPDKERG